MDIIVMSDGGKQTLYSKRIFDTNTDRMAAYETTQPYKASGGGYSKDADNSIIMQQAQSNLETAKKVALLNGLATAMDISIATGKIALCFIPGTGQLFMIGFGVVDGTTALANGKYGEALCANNT